MAASRKTYRLLAEQLASNLQRAVGGDKDVVAKVVRDLGFALKVDNPAFRYDKFFEAVGLDMHGYVPGTRHTKGA